MMGLSRFYGQRAAYFPSDGGAEARLTSLLPCLSRGGPRAPSAQGRRELPRGPGCRGTRYKTVAMNPNGDSPWSTELAAAVIPV